LTLFWRGDSLFVVSHALPRRLAASVAAVAIAISLAACGAPPVTAPTGAAPAAATRKVLYLTHSAGYKHDVLPLSAQILQDVGRRAGAFEVTATDDSSLVTHDNLARYDAVVFFTSGELPMSETQRAALLDFVRSGKGFAGIHSATDTFYDWGDYGALVGAYFDGHPWHQTVMLRVEDRAHPATSALPATFALSDEIYQFRSWSRAGVHVLVSLDAASVDVTAPGVNRADRDFALAWTRSEGRGRMFYTALGHEPAVWQDTRFQQHLLGGIRWAMGDQ
jgi:type 1 glutamine amidotransferase